MNEAKEILNTINSVSMATKQDTLDVMNALYEFGFTENEIDYIPSQEKNLLPLIIKLLNALMLLFDDDHEQVLKYLRVKHQILDGQTGIEAMKHESSIQLMSKNALSISHGVYQ